MKQGRRDFLEPIRNPQGVGATVRGIEVRTQRIERAPVKFSLERVIPPKRAPQSRVTGVVVQPVSLFTQTQIYSAAADTWTAHGGPATDTGNGQPISKSGAAFYQYRDPGDFVRKLARSTDRGVTWDVLALPMADTFSQAIDADGNLWVADGVDGIYKSVNDGDSFALSTAPLDGGDVIGLLATHPTDGDRIIAQVEPSTSEVYVYVTSDGGSNWDRILVDSGIIPSGATDSPPIWLAGGRVVLIVRDAATNTLISYYSNDTGATWTAGDTVANDPPDAREVVAGAHDDIYAAISGSPDRIWRSIDGGETFDVLTSPAAWVLGMAFAGGILYILGNDDSLHRVVNPRTTWAPEALDAATNEEISHALGVMR